VPQGGGKNRWGDSINTRRKRGDVNLCFPFWGKKGGERAFGRKRGGPDELGKKICGRLSKRGGGVTIAWGENIQRGVYTAEPGRKEDVEL